MLSRLKHFLDTFGEPRPPRPQIIPQKWRIPFYISLSVLSLIAVLILVIYVVLPGIIAQQARTDARTGVSAPSK